MPQALTRLRNDVVRDGGCQLQYPIPNIEILNRRSRPEERSDVGNYSKFQISNDQNGEPRLPQALTRLRNDGGDWAVSIQRRTGVLRRSPAMTRGGRTNKQRRFLTIIQRVIHLIVSFMNEIIFIVEDAPEGGFTARALGHSIFTEADTFKELKVQVRDAVRCHFGDEAPPPLIRLHQVKDEVITV